MMDEMYQANISQNIDSAMDNMRIAVTEAANLWAAPHVLMRPSFSIDGNKWCALYGEDLVRGVAGFGDTPAEAAADFDRAWYTQSAGKGEG